jgi:hypothetical protein
VIRFDESVKAVNASPLNVMGERAGQYAVKLTVLNARGSWDDLSIRFDPSSHAEAGDSYDGNKLSNDLFDFYSITPDNSRLCVDSRSDTSVFSARIPLGMRSLVTGTGFRIELSRAVLPSGVSVYLRDKLKGTELLVKEGESLPFDMTTDPATTGEQRFELVLKASPVVTNPLSDQIDASVGVNNPVHDQLQIRLHSGWFSASGKVQIRIMDMNGRILTNVQTTHATTTINIPVSSLSAGLYLLEVRNDQQATTKKFIKD